MSDTFNNPQGHGDNAAAEPVHVVAVDSAESSGRDLLVQ